MSFGIPVRNGLGIGLRASTALSTRGGSGPPAEPGQQAFITPGTFSWVAPAGVTSVCVVCVGGGARSGAGGLGWKNNIAVIPGNSYSVRVGTAAPNSGADAQSSFFINDATVSGGGGTRGTPGGTFIGDGGGNGGGSTSLTAGGAGGYTGNGAAGSNSYNVDGAAGSGGGGGSSAGISSGGNFYAGGGGGVGILGEGSNGAGGTRPSGIFAGGGGGGSGGAAGGTGTSALSPGDGGLYGGAGGASFDGATFTFRLGAAGAVRIIWGAGRAFPSTNTGDV